MKAPSTVRGYLLWGLLIALVSFAALTAIWLARYTFAVNGLSRGIGQTYFYGADGKRWFPLEEHRIDVPLGRVAPDLQHAVVAVEDRRFYSHPGVDPVGIGRALLHDLRARSIEEGASTITQQLARTIFLTNQRNVGRKLKEMALALMIERRLSKPKILELYLNRVFYGSNVYGVEAMSRNVFGKSCADLTLAESAFLAGIIQTPANLWPWGHYDRALERSHTVLSRMREEHFITAEAERAAEAVRPKVLPSPGLTSDGAGYAEDYLRRQFKSGFEDDNPPDWKVQTTFLPDVQREAERAVTAGLQRWPSEDLQAALVALDPQTGDVLALVGGRDFGRSPFNRATSARRQPGSAFKPILYAAALQSGMSPISLVSDLAQLHVQGHDEWVVKNATADTRDSLTLREALFESNNQAAVRLLTQVGSRQVLTLSTALGMPGLPDVPSLALGVGEVTPLQLTAAFAAIANGGYAVTPRFISRVIDANGYAVLDQDVARTQVMSDAAAFQVVSMLEDVIDVGTGAAARSLGVRFPAAGKTGTTDDFKDAWFVGFSSGIVAGVWVGLDRPGSIAPDAFGARYALPIWADFMVKAASVRPPQPFQPPASVQRVELCRVSHLRPTELCPRYSEYFKAGDVVPEQSCDIHQGPSRTVTQAIGGLFSRIGKGIRSIFGK
jgi:1A family penicillin-binding protein